MEEGHFCRKSNLNRCSNRYEFKESFIEKAGSHQPFSLRKVFYNETSKENCPQAHQAGAEGRCKKQKPCKSHLASGKLWSGESVTQNDSIEPPPDSPKYRRSTEHSYSDRNCYA